VVTGEPDSPLRFTYQRSAIDWRRTALILILLAAAAAVVFARGRDPLYLTAMALLLFHWGFHTVFGEELLLYSRHWNVAAALLLFALVPAAPARPLVRALLLVIACAVAVNTGYVIWQMGQALAAHQPLLTLAERQSLMADPGAAPWRM
jgi:hypothetical protein